MGHESDSGSPVKSGKGRGIPLSGFGNKNGGFKSSSGFSGSDGFDEQAPHLQEMEEQVIDGEREQRRGQDSMAGTVTDATDTPDVSENKNVDASDSGGRIENKLLNPASTQVSVKGEYILRGYLTEEPRCLSGGGFRKAMSSRNKRAFCRLRINAGSAGRRRIFEMTCFLPVSMKSNGIPGVSLERGDAVQATVGVKEYRGKKEFFVKEDDIQKVVLRSRDTMSRTLMNVNEVGEKTANRIIETLGSNEEEYTLDNLTGMGVRQSVAEEIVKYFATGAEYAKSFNTLRHKYNISKKLVDSLINEFGPNVVSSLEENPWSILRKNGQFILADEIAKQNRIPLDAKDRIRSGIAYHIRQKIGGDYSTCWVAGNTEGSSGKDIENGNFSDLVNQRGFREIVSELNGKSREELISREKLGDALNYLFSKRCIEENPSMALKCYEASNGDILIYPYESYKLEKKLAKQIMDIASLPPPRKREDVIPVMHEVCKSVSKKLNKEQEEAVISACTNRFTIITGGAGTGKSTIQDIVVRVLETFGEKVCQSSPTGKAAKRLAETTGREAGTIHKMLEVDTQDGAFYFKRNFENPINAGNVVSCDETSMGDERIMSSFFDAMPVNPSVILSGDFNQLASVGAGQVFRDIIEADCGFVNVVKLVESRRTNENSDLTWFGREIIKGNNPWDEYEKLVQNGTKKGKPRGVTGIDCRNGQISDRVQKVARILSMKGYENKDIITLSPARKDQNGVFKPGTVPDINQLMKNLLNPPRNKAEQKIGTFGFTPDDPVIVTKNNYKHYIFNGEEGIVKDIDLKNPNEPSITIDIDGREVTLEGEDMNLLDLAYSNTVHKFQGSERPAVIFVVPENSFNMTRNLIYTAVTRAEKEVYIIGDMKTLQEGIEKEEFRQTGLSQMLSEMSGEIANQNLMERIQSNPYLSRLFENIDRIYPPKYVETIKEAVSKTGVSFDEVQRSINERKHGPHIENDDNDSEMEMTPGVANDFLYLN